jgi:hypothetical protein
MIAIVNPLPLPGLRYSGAGMTARLLPLLTFLVAAAFAWPAGAQTTRFEEGYAAYQNKDYDTALYYWMPLAENNQANAQYNIGIMYLYGRGVPVSAAKALMWLLLARDNHMDQADQAVAQLETKVKPEELNEGLRLRDEWHRAHGF